MRPQQQQELDANRRRAAVPSLTAAAAMVLCCLHAQLPACSAFAFSASATTPPAAGRRSRGGCSSSSSSSRAAALSMSMSLSTSMPRWGCLRGASGYEGGASPSSGGQPTATAATATTAAAALVASRGGGGSRTRMMMSSDGSSSGGGGSSEEESDEEQEARAEREFASIFDKNSAILEVPVETFDDANVEPLMPGSVRTQLPVFILGMNACPGGVIPLHIFEMRYRQMFNDIQNADNRFGLLLMDPDTKRPCKYGSVMECATRQLLPDGRQYNLNQAIERFRVLKVLQSSPYPIMEVEAGIPDSKPVEGEPQRWGADEGMGLEDVELEVQATVNSVVELMNKLIPPATPGENRTLSEWFLRYAPKVKRDEGLEGESAGDELDLAQQAKEDERRMNFSFAVAEMIAMTPDTKQRLLQSRSTAYRLVAVREILRKAQKQLAAKASLKDTLG